MQTVCCVCRRIKGKRGWLRGKGGAGEEVSHGYCPDCFQRTMERAEGFSRLHPGQDKAILPVR